MKSLFGFIGLYLLFVVFIPTAHSESDSLRFEYLSAKQGLPKTAINTIVQDKEGFMWFGTDNGLYKYDGHTTTAFQTDLVSPNHALRSNSIKDIHEDKKGRLWVITSSGLHQIQTQSNIVIAYPIHSTQAIGWNSLSFIYEDLT
jgi:ligand-binding sensor domain-containing protein